MISDPNLILYACVSKGTTILAEFNSGDSNLSALASQCLKKTPPHHSMFSHTIRKRTYTFLLDNPNQFVFFSIVDENLNQTEGFWFLNQLKNTLYETTKRKKIACLENPSSHCLQNEFNPLFQNLLASRVSELDSVCSVDSVLKNGSTLSSDESIIGKKIGTKPLLKKPCKAWLKSKKKKSSTEKKVEDKDKVIESKVDVIENRDFPIEYHKNGLFTGDVGRHKANQTWRRFVLLALGFDLVVLFLMLAVWLWICRGFKCIHE